MPPDARQGGRVLPLDGLRGLLALGVFLGHASFYSAYWRDNAWQAGSMFWATIGPVAVSLFFMITAYLFYGRMIAEQGRADWRGLYIGRLFRLAPVYLMAIAVLFGFVAAASGFRLRVPPVQLMGETLAWLALGAGPRVDLNGVFDTRHLMAGVTWTLQSEWLFYASLPLLALATRGRRGRIALLMPVIGLAVTLVFLAVAAPNDFPACVGPFFAGMTCAALPKAAKAAGWPGSLFVIVSMAAIFVAGIDPRSPLAILLLGSGFYVMVSGCTVFGLLTCGPVRWLGSISYGVYLLHGLVMSALGAIVPLRAFALGSPTHHALVVLLATVFVLALAHAAHVLIEEPGIRFGKHVAGRGGSLPDHLVTALDPEPGLSQSRV